MGFETKIKCDECTNEETYDNALLKTAETAFFSDGGSKVGEQYLCAVCTWRHRKNYFAIDVDLPGNGDFQVLAVVKDKECFSDSQISFGRLERGTGIIVRRISQPEYETLKEFGISAVESHTVLHFDLSKGQPFFHNTPHDNPEPENDKHEIDGYNQRTEDVIDLSNAVEELFANELPKAETPRVIIEAFREND